MPKIKALIRIKNDDVVEELKTTIIIQDNKLKYKEKDNTTMIIDLKNDKMTRENNNLKMEFSFSLSHKTKGIIYLKDMNQTLNVEIKTKSLEKTNNDIEIEYEIEKQSFLYHMEEIK